MASDTDLLRRNEPGIARLDRSLTPVVDRWLRLRARLERVPARWYAAPTIGVAIGIALSTIQLWPEIWRERGTDYGFMVGHARRWLDGGGFYQAEQLAGSYAGTSFTNYYPPPALLLFLPFTVLPGPLWWAIPLGVIAWFVLSERPAGWSWPILALLCYLPRTQSIVIWGNPTMWVTAFVALGLRFAWPSVIVLVKPYFAPFALIGFWRREWAPGAVAFAAINVVLLPLWFEYLAAWRNARSWPGIGYSPADFLMVLIPVVAWFAGRRRLSAPSIRAPRP